MSQSFADLGLMAELSRACADEGYTQPTPVQLQAIPVILQGRDVLAGAQTGTGKTAGFGLPLLQRLMSTEPASLMPHVRALIVTPTRELAAQVEENIRDYGRYLPLRSAVVFGGVPMAQQIEMLQEGAEILVATPGRLLDHCNEQTVDLSQVEVLVLDEADRMLDMGFIHDVQRILSLLPAQRQNLLFSATFSDDVRALAQGLLHEPVHIEAGDRANTESELVSQRLLSTGQDRKRALLTHLIKGGNWRQVLVFTRTKHGANRLAHQLGRGGIAATAIHGNKAQGARVKALDDFKAGKVRVLVATDLAARGLDIAELPHVVNYDLPQVAEDYVHRIGRTGRAGVSGEAVSLVSPEEQPLLSEIAKLIGRTMELTTIPGFEPGSVPPNQQHRQQQQARQNQPVPPAAEDGAKEGREGREGRGRRRGRGRNRHNGDARNDSGTRDGTLPGQEGNAEAVRSAQSAPREMREPREPNFNRADGQGNRNRQRNDAAREDRDNRGNRDTSNRNKRHVILDDDFGNRIQPVKAPRGIRARIAAGDIDEALDNIGNRIPPLPKHLQNLTEDDEINYNVAPPEPSTEYDDDDDRQPQSNAGQLFPSSAGFMGDGARRGKGGNGNGNGNNRRRKRRRGTGQDALGQPGMQAQRGQQRQPQSQQQRPGHKGGGRGRNGRPQERRRAQQH